ncbi:MAG: hypothetical protein K0Q71_3985, partial [Thermomicrobiales bacterium]|nr:hypothetical protein [Thermomicrobiales bacterium]
DHISPAAQFFSARSAELRRCLQAREDSGEDDSHASEDPHASVHHFLKGRENTGSNKRCKDHYRDAQSHVQRREPVCHGKVGL